MATPVPQKEHFKQMRTNRRATATGRYPVERKMLCLLHKVQPKVAWSHESAFGVTEAARIVVERAQECAGKAAKMA